MIRFCRDANIPLYILFIKIEESAPGQTKQTIIFSVDKSQNSPNLSRYCIPHGDIDSLIQSKKDFIFYFRGNDTFPLYGYVKPSGFANEKCVYCLLSPFYNPQKMFGLISRYFAEETVKGIDFLRRNSKIVLDKNLQVQEEKQLLNDCLSDLIKRFSPHDIGLMIVNLVIDSKFIIISNEIENVSKVGFGLLAAIYPLTWPGIFISPLPDDLVDTVQAPFPYIIGMHNSLINNPDLSNIENHILVDVDKKTVTASPNPYHFPDKVMRAIGIFEKKTKSSKFNLEKFSQNAHKLVLKMLRIAFDKSFDKPDELYKKWDKLRNKKQLVLDLNLNPPFRDLVLSSQLVLGLMREIEIGKESSVFYSYFLPDEVFENVYESCPINTIQIPDNKEEGKNSFLVQISELVSKFKASYNGSIDDYIKMRKEAQNIRPAGSNVVENPEQLSLQDRIAIYRGDFKPRVDLPAAQRAGISSSDHNVIGTVPESKPRVRLENKDLNKGLSPKLPSGKPRKIFTMFPVDKLKLPSGQKESKTEAHPSTKVSMKKKKEK